MRSLRDVSFLWKWAMCPSNRVHPGSLTTLNGYSPHQLKPKWETRQGKFRVVAADMDLLDLFMRHMQNTDPFRVQRHPSGALVSFVVLA